MRNCGQPPPMVFIGTPENDAAWAAYRRCLGLVPVPGQPGMFQQGPLGDAAIDASPVWRLGLLGGMAALAYLMWKAQRT